MWVRQSETNGSPKGLAFLGPKGPEMLVVYIFCKFWIVNKMSVKFQLEQNLFLDDVLYKWSFGKPTTHIHFASNDDTHKFRFRLPSFWCHKKNNSSPEAWYKL